MSEEKTYTSKEWEDKWSSGIKVQRTDDTLMVTVKEPIPNTKSSATYHLDADETDELIEFLNTE